MPRTGYGPRSAATSSAPVVYLKRNLKDVLPQALQEICQLRPIDPIDYLARWLYKHVDCEMYYHEKAMFAKEIRIMALELQKQSVRRRAHIKTIRNEINDLKVVLKSEKGMPAHVWKEVAKRASVKASKTTAEFQEDIDELQEEVDGPAHLPVIVEAESIEHIPEEADISSKKDLLQSSRSSPKLRSSESSSAAIVVSESGPSIAKVASRRSRQKSSFHRPSRPSLRKQERPPQAALSDEDKPRWLQDKRKRSKQRKSTSDKLFPDTQEVLAAMKKERENEKGKERLKTLIQEREKNQRQEMQEKMRRMEAKKLHEKEAARIESMAEIYKTAAEMSPTSSDSEEETELEFSTTSVTQSITGDHFPIDERGAGPSRPSGISKPSITKTLSDDRRPLSKMLVEDEADEPVHVRRKTDKPLDVRRQIEKPIDVQSKLDKPVDVRRKPGKPVDMRSKIVKSPMMWKPAMQPEERRTEEAEEEEDKTDEDETDEDETDEEIIRETTVTRQMQKVKPTEERKSEKKRGMEKPVKKKPKYKVGKTVMTWEKDVGQPESDVASPEESEDDMEIAPETVLYMEQIRKISARAGRGEAPSVDGQAPQGDMQEDDEDAYGKPTRPVVKKKKIKKQPLIEESRASNMLASGSLKSESPDSEPSASESPVPNIIATSEESEPDQDSRAPAPAPTRTPIKRQVKKKIVPERHASEEVPIIDQQEIQFDEPLPTVGQQDIQFDEQTYDDDVDQRPTKPVVRKTKTKKQIVTPESSAPQFLDSEATATSEESEADQEIRVRRKPIVKKSKVVREKDETVEVSIVDQQEIQLDEPTYNGGVDQTPAKPVAKKKIRKPPMTLESLVSEPLPPEVFSPELPPPGVVTSMTSVEDQDVKIVTPAPAEIPSKRPLKKKVVVKEREMEPGTSAAYEQDVKKEWRKISFEDESDRPDVSKVKPEESYSGDVSATSSAEAFSAVEIAPVVTTPAGRKKGPVGRRIKQQVTDDLKDDTVVDQIRIEDEEPVKEEPREEVQDIVTEPGGKPTAERGRRKKKAPTISTEPSSPPSGTEPIPTVALVTDDEAPYTGDETLLGADARKLEVEQSPSVRRDRPKGNRKTLPTPLVLPSATVSLTSRQETDSVSVGGESDSEFEASSTYEPSTSPLDDRTQQPSPPQRLRPLVPVPCKWVLQEPHVLICQHPILGSITSHPPNVQAEADTPAYWDRKGFHYEMLYDPEIYTVTDPHADDMQYEGLLDISHASPTPTELSHAGFLPSSTTSKTSHEMTEKGPAALQEGDDTGIQIFVQEQPEFHEATD